MVPSSPAMVDVLVFAGMAVVFGLILVGAVLLGYVLGRRTRVVILPDGKVQDLSDFPVPPANEMTKYEPTPTPWETAMEGGEQ